MLLIGNYTHRRGEASYFFTFNSFLFCVGFFFGKTFIFLPEMTLSCTKKLCIVSEHLAPWQSNILFFQCLKFSLRLLDCKCRKFPKTFRSWCYFLNRSKQPETKGRSFCLFSEVLFLTFTQSSINFFKYNPSPLHPSPKNFLERG